MEKTPVIARVHRGILTQEALDALNVVGGTFGRGFNIYGSREISETIESFRQRIQQLSPDAEVEIIDN